MITPEQLLPDDVTALHALIRAMEGELAVFRALHEFPKHKLTDKEIVLNIIEAFGKDLDIDSLAGHINAIFGTPISYSRAASLHNQYNRFKLL